MISFYVYVLTVLSTSEEALEFDSMLESDSSSATVIRQHQFHRSCGIVF